MMKFFKPNSRLMAWLALLAVALAACAPAARPATQSGVEMARTEPPASVAPSEPTEQAATEPPAAATPAEQAAATNAPAQPVISNEFTPSDPATVSLAAGRPQFVEFFAFW